ncbi:MAG: FtsQ-type POTRA domain-containing protein [Dehalococcoidia bacterium]|nr:FtsQ-type POTRA domain-containing protein [Dehalococcoidia bacterium]
MSDRHGRDNEQLPRQIVRRKPAVVGERRREIVRRGAPSGGGVQPPRRRWRPSLPHPRWRPSKGFAALVGVLAVLVMLGGGAYWALTSPFFKVNNVEVTGNERITSDLLVNRAELLGESMFTADLASAQQRLYGHPLVAGVRIERAWPSTVRLIVEERQAWGAWEQGGVRYTIDRDGVVLSSVASPEGVPLIRSSETTTLRQGDRVNYQAVQAAAEIYELLPRQLGTTVTEVAFLAGKGVQVTTADGQSALLGDSSAIAYKLSVWAAMSKQAMERGINYTTIDLRFGNRPVLQ